MIIQNVICAICVICAIGKLSVQKFSLLPVTGARGGQPNSNLIFRFGFGFGSNFGWIEVLSILKKNWRREFVQTRGISVCLFHKLCV